MAKASFVQRHPWLSLYAGLTAALVLYAEVELSAERKRKLLTGEA